MITRNIQIVRSLLLLINDHSRSWFSWRLDATVSGFATQKRTKRAFHLGNCPVIWVWHIGIWNESDRGRARWPSVSSIYTYMQFPTIQLHNRRVVNARGAALFDQHRIRKVEIIIINNYLFIHNFHWIIIINNAPFVHINVLPIARAQSMASARLAEYRARARTHGKS